jgi:arsenate reductase
MAEGLLRHLYGEHYEAYSAGIQPTRVNPYAVAVMREIGIDIAHNTAKSVNEFVGLEFDYIVTVCDQAREACPFFPHGKNYLHHSFEDPSSAAGKEEDKLNKFRQIRNEIKKWLEKNFTKLE